MRSLVVADDGAALHEGDAHVATEVLVQRARQAPGSTAACSVQVSHDFAVDSAVLLCLVRRSGGTAMAAGSRASHDARARIRQAADGLARWLRAALRAQERSTPRDA